MKLTLACLFVTMATASVAPAQDAPSDPVMKFSYTWMVAGNIADLWTTQQAFVRGAHEGNGFTATTNIRPLAASKASFTLGIALAMRLLETHSHPKVARWVGFIDGSVALAAALHNQGVAR